MNLDALFQQIQFTEKQAREKRSLIQQGQPPGQQPAGAAAALTALKAFSLSRGESSAAAVRAPSPGQARPADRVAASCQWRGFVRVQRLQTEHAFLQAFVILQLNLT